MGYNNQKDLPAFTIANFTTSFHVKNINNKMSQINWNNKTTKELYDHFDNLETPEKTDFLLHLFKIFPKLDIAWIDLIEDIRDSLLFMHQPEKVIELVDLFIKNFPGEYIDEYEFIEKSLITYYLFNNNLDKVKQRLEMVKRNPAKGVDTVTISALFQLIYYGHYSTALEYSHAVWKPIYESDEIMGYPHFHFCTTIYLDALEKAYINLKKGISVNWKILMTEMEEFDIQEDEKIFQNICLSLETPFSKDEIINLIESRKHKEVNLILNIHFLKYMKDHFDVPFMLSDRWWNILTVKGLFGKKKDADGYFYIPYKVLNKHFTSHYDSMFLSNDIEIFGKVWGLEYVYHFLREYMLIDEENFNRMNENISCIKYLFMRITDESLWKMSYIFNWPQLNLPDPYEKVLFQSTFTSNIDDLGDKVDNYLNNKYQVFPERIKRELDTHKVNDYNLPESEGWDDEYPQLPHVKESPDIGRNDQCPCGSGKKYKKCCMNLNK